MSSRLGSIRTGQMKPHRKWRLSSSGVEAEVAEVVVVSVEDAAEEVATADPETVAMTNKKARNIIIFQSSA